ncbi:hypothetical protein OMP38_10290 [Cohnella ginsengisoli]|uniref:Response regulator n=1 Tax=Cohnella ginsengisoli TaxID=425004 RepID=A0A9X4KGQ6_9BACL|nr:hypothetical protein [Cohnella ginsengisoli]MDG0791214.1 hypothetical protein [Cohnella ginsengisoli]
MERIVTMCVIDDIKTVVNGIATRIPWERHGIEVVGTALDGAEGLALIRDKKAGHRRHRYSHAGS